MGFNSKPRGGKRPGAGRKSNAVKLQEAGFVADWLTREFQEIKWNQLVNSKDEMVALRAMAYLTDRLYGKPRQQHEISTDLKIQTVILKPHPIGERPRLPLKPEW
ncbi:MAG: hypothetical protein WBQ94_02125 [Terracidiphilus sp.]